MPAPLCLTLAAIACCAQCRVLVSRKADAQAVQQQLAFSRGDAHRHCLSGDSQGLHTASIPTHDLRQSCCGRLLCPPDPNPLRGADDADDDSSSQHHVEQQRPRQQ